MWGVGGYDICSHQSVPLWQASALGFCCTHRWGLKLWFCATTARESSPIKVTYTWSTFGLSPLIDIPLVAERNSFLQLLVINIETQQTSDQTSIRCCGYYTQSLLTYSFLNTTHKFPYITSYTSSYLNWEKQVVNQRLHESLISSYILLTSAHTLSYLHWEKQVVDHQFIYSPLSPA